MEKTMIFIQIEDEVELLIRESGESTLNHSHTYWQTIFTKQVEELAAAVLELLSGRREEAFIKWLIKVAAVCVAWLEDDELWK
ncbi:hypothetical protein KAR91_27530 [Candidatus Pacearchaeota archaeon]|nr:hypothetical protein [Candidatus Pacearchaeota archaeon]